MMDKTSNIDKAFTFVNYFHGNLSDSNNFWEYGYEISLEWLRLLKLGNYDVLDAKHLCEKVNNPPNIQGCAYEDLKMLINNWYDETQSLT